MTGSVSLTAYRRAAPDLTSGSEPSGLRGEQASQHFRRLRVRSCRFGGHPVPLVRLERPPDIGKAAECFVRPGWLGCGRQNHEAGRRLHSDASNDEDFTLSPQHRDRIVDRRLLQKGLGRGHHTRAVISLSRTARSPDVDDLIRYENSPVWSAGIRRVTS